MRFKEYYLLGLAISMLTLTGCKDGIKMPWSKDKPHEAEVSFDTAETSVDSLALQDVADSLNVSDSDSLQQPTETDQPTTSGSEVSNQKMWRIVVSSMPSQEMANKFIGRYQISGARILYVDRLNTYRVVQASFQELSDAQVEFNLIKSDFPDAWLVYF